MKKITNLLTILLLSSLFIQSVIACGPNTIDPLFSFTKHADYPLNEFAKGKIGNIPSSYGRMSLFIFYRELNDLPLSANEQKQYLQALNNRIVPSNRNLDNNSAESINKNSGEFQWKTSRAKVLSGEPNVETEKRDNDEYYQYASCLDDAFKTASQTLENRIAKYGVNEDVKEWTKGQDSVFANCSEKRSFPKKLGNETAEWLKKDRDYQIAAAYFYAENFPKAREIFSEIAADNNSVWQKTAKFVVARTYIREAGLIDENTPDYPPVPKTVYSNSNANSSVVLNQAEIDTYYANRKEIRSIEQKKEDKIKLFQQAENQLKNILADNSMSEFHASAQRLQNYVGFRAKPREQRRELANNLVKKGDNNNLYNDLVDYIWLLDVVDNESRDRGMETDRKAAEAEGKEYGYDYKLKRRDIPNDELGADLTDWLFAYQTVDSFNHSFAKWEETKSLAWFVATIAKATKDSPKIADILSEANKIKTDSPAFATVRYHQIRLLMESGKMAEAQQKLDEILKIINKYPRSTQNDFLSQRMKLANNLDDFLKYAQRQAATFIWSDDGNEEGADLKESPELEVWKDKTMFDLDSVGIFNEKMPLSVLRQAALSPNLPNHLKKFLVIAVWTRSFILGNNAIHQEFTPLMAKFAPEYKVSTESSIDNSLLAIVRNPAIQPYIPYGMGRGETMTNSIDSIRGNWWCLENKNQQDYPNFMSNAQKAEASSELKKMASMGESATFLAKQAVEFANANMTNPNTPEILHLAVRSTRYGCKDANTLRYSKAAFDILHKRFPNNQWTKKTPYYFGERQN